MHFSFAASHACGITTTVKKEKKGEKYVEVAQCSHDKCPHRSEYLPFSSCRFLLFFFSW